MIKTLALLTAVLFISKENLSVNRRAGKNRAVKMIKSPAETARQNRDVISENFCGSFQGKLRVRKILVGRIFFDRHIFFACPINRRTFRTVEVSD